MWIKDQPCYDSAKFNLFCIALALLIRQIRWPSKGSLDRNSTTPLSFSEMKFHERSNSFREYELCDFCLLSLDHHYVSISLRKQGKNLKKQRTSIVKHDPNPTFGKSLVFDVPSCEIENCTLVIKVRHHGDINRDRTFAILRVGHNSQGNESAHWNDMIETGQCVTRWHRMLRIEPADDH